MHFGKFASYLWDFGLGIWVSPVKEDTETFIRIITVSKYNAHTEPLFKALDLLKLKDMLNLSTLKFYYRYLHDNLPAYFYSFQITTQGSHHHYNTRHSDQIHVGHFMLIKESEYTSLKWSTQFRYPFSKKLLRTVSRVSQQTSLNTSSINIQTYAS